MKLLTVITGQTATGKTSLGLKLASQSKGELINSDSRQIYQHLDIITGKDLSRKLKKGKNQFNLVSKINHFQIGYYQKNNFKIWLYDIVDPKQPFSSFDYQLCSLNIIKKLLKENKTPIIVGGTYFYIYHLLYQIKTENIPPNWSLRKELNKKTVGQLQEILKKQNPQLFNQLNPSDQKNPQRLIRKIEISKILKKTQQLDLKIKFKKKIILPEKLAIPDLKIKFIGLRFKTKEKLKKTIKNRVEERLKKGAIEEVSSLLKQGYSPEDPGLKTIGYKEIIKYLKNQISKEQAINQWITKEIQYSKRQLTFMKKDPNIVWKEV